MTNTLKRSNDNGFAVLVENISEMIRVKTGNIITETQMPMVESRLNRRLIELGRISPLEYMQMIKDPSSHEQEKLIGLLTTHHTHFFREFIQFEALEKMLPEMVSKAKQSGRNKLHIWSAACSRGQEVYSLAMFLKKLLPKIDANFSFKILGSDVDPESVEVAKNGVYHKREIKEVPLVYLEGSWARGSGNIADYVRASKGLKEYCTFKVANLLDFSLALAGEKFDIIFCRNVFIYFDQDNIKKIFNNMTKFLYPHGTFFSGLSEPLSQLGLNIHSVGPSVYRLGLAQSNLKVLPTVKSIDSPVVAKSTWSLPKPIKLLVVDDSKTVHSILKNIFSKDPDFKIVGNVMNGQEAEEFLKSNKVDAVTLDIHMPVMDGVQYLQKNFHPKHPPVVIVSSASREDSATALKTLKLGASDFVEKPNLQNLAQVADELKNKIKMSLLYSSQGPSSFDKEFSAPIKITSPNKALRIVFADLPQAPQVAKIWKEFSSNQPPTIWVPIAHGEFIEAFVTQAKGFQNVKNSKVSKLEDLNLSCNEIYVATRVDLEKSLSKLMNNKKCSVLFFGRPSEASLGLLKKLKGSQILIEELPDHLPATKSVATDMFPTTSFAYVSSKYLGEE